MTTPDQQHLDQTRRLQVRQLMLAAAFAGMAAVALTGCGGTGADASGSAAAPTLAVIQEDSAAEVAAREQAWVDKQAREAAIAAAAQATATAQAELDQAVTALEAKGASVSYIIVDIATGATIEHNADALYYSASSVKGPYCVSLVRERGAQARESYGDVIRACLVNSSNDDYNALRETYKHERFFQNFGSEAGVSADLSGWYADYSARELARLWALADSWLTAGSEDAAWVGEFLGDTLYSQVDDIAGGDGIVTWSKAGWYPGGDRGAVTFDGGAIHTQAGDYAIAVAVDRDSDFKAIRSIMEPLVALHEAQAIQRS